MSTKYGLTKIVVATCLMCRVCSSWAETPAEFELQKLLASDGSAGNLLGISVAVDGDTAVAGPEAKESAYVFVRDGSGTWVEQAKLVAFDGVQGDAFGRRVAISGNTVLVGALADNDNGSASGSAYVFVRDGIGNWTEQAKLLASDGAAGDLFGVAVALDGDTAIIGAGADDTNGSNTGSAYIFVRDGSGNWTEQAELLASDGANADRFGNAVALDGDTAIISIRETVAKGAAYVFVRDGSGNWTEQAKLLASDGAPGDSFGLFAVALSNDTAIIGARATVDNGANSGSAYVFVRDGSGNWTERAKLLASDGSAGDVFGFSVAADGGTAIIGAPQNNDARAPSPNSGSAYRFVRGGGGDWIEQTKLLPCSGSAGGAFGQSVAVSGSTAIVGAIRDDDNGASAGSAYRYALGTVGALVANAGSDQVISEGALVELDGSASAGGCSPLAYQWTQLPGGPPVTLSVIDPVHPTFNAPGIPVSGATLTFQLVVSNGIISSVPDAVNITVKNVNKPPVADAGSDQTVNEGSPVTLDGTGSFDMDAEVLTYSWTQTAGAPVILDISDPEKPEFTAPLVGAAGDTLTFKLAVSDGIDTAMDTVNVIVDNINHPPVAYAGMDQTVAEGALVTLDGSNSSDPDSDSLTYQWNQSGGTTAPLSDSHTVMPTITAPQVSVGGQTLMFDLAVNDGVLTSGIDTVNITVQNINDPPLCQLAQVGPGVLWPPNHKLIAVSISGISDPDNDGVTLNVTGVTQDEPTNGLGDGDTSPDAAVQGDTVLLRAERSGTGNGRVYRVLFTADDGKSGNCSGSVTVNVPHSKKGTAVDDGQSYDSTQL
ncbi:MAG: hypothetical protein FD165_2720 [Gammaproteobacteria bacterium]|nr:MAG: hypothetical protein FD165_2720 [Gammaproteobacteria bacterium]TND01404.1 MAG: hypothetical protein FD120_2577 [Gammaproteobacteria bacterium]